MLTIMKASVSEDDLFGIVVDAGADDITVEGEVYEVITSPDNFESVKSALNDSDITFDSAELTQIPTTTKDIDGSDARNLLQLMEHLENHDDVQNVYSNFDIDEKILEEMAAV